MPSFPIVILGPFLLLYEILNILFSAIGSGADFSEIIRIMTDFITSLF